MGEVFEAFDEFCMGFSIDFVGGAFFRLDGSDVVEPSHERIASDESRINGDECEQWHAFGVIGIAERPRFDAIVEFELFEHDFIEQVVAPESAWTVRTRHEKDDFFVVGVLQLEVLEYRLKNEYNVDVIRNDLPYQYIRWVKNKDIDIKALNLTSDTKWVQDFKNNNLLIFTSEWNINWAEERNEGLILEDFSKD